MPGTKWSAEELTLALKLYFTTPYLKISKKDRRLMELSSILNRSPGAVYAKLGNFARLDPEMKKLKVRGLENGGKLDIIIWDRYSDDLHSLSRDAEAILQKRKKTVA